MGFTEEDIVLISVGELNVNKNHEIVIKAMSHLKDRRIKYIICGQGYLKEYLEKLARNNNVEKQVKLLGYQSDIPQLLAMSDIFVFPSKREGLGMALIEALASGLPCIACDNRGSRELVEDGRNGVIVLENSDCVEMAKAIQGIQKNLLQKYNFSMTSQYRARMFSVEIVNKQMKKVYGEYIE